MSRANGDHAAQKGDSEKRLRVLIIAEAANPEWVSVPLVGWSHASALRNVVDAHTVTQVRNREAILRADWREGIDFTSIDSEAVARYVWKTATLLRGGTGKSWTTDTAMSAIAYYFFEHLLWKLFGPRIRSGEFDIVHRVTPLSPTTPSIIAGRCRRAGVPFVWGPINGGAPWPKGFGGVRRREREWLSYVREAYRLMPGYRSTRANASAIIVASRDTLSQIPDRYRAKCVYIPENGVDPDRFTLQAAHESLAPLRVAFVGRLVPYKGADMLLEAAVPLVREGKVCIDIIGDGPEMPALKELVARERVTQGVQIDGWVEHADLQARLIQSSVLGFPSIREFGGGVALEAMALGLVPIVIDYAGPAELVTASTGYKVPMAARDRIVQDLRVLLAQLAADPTGLPEMGKRARERVFRLFTWDAKARQTLEVYRWVAGHRADKPDFGMPFPDTD